MTTIFVGNDWAVDHHDVWVMDTAGKRLASRRFAEGLEGMAGMHELLARFAEEPGEVVIGIETDHGLWVQQLVAAGYQVYAINPKAAARYRDRHHLSGAKSDTADARMLADLVRTDRHQHRQIAGNSALAEEITILARAQQDLIWEQSRHLNRLRAGLLEYYPAAVPLLDTQEFTRRDMLAVLSKAPEPALGRKLTHSQIRNILRRAGRQRNLDATAEKIQQVLRSKQLQAPESLVRAHGARTRSILAQLRTLQEEIAELTAVEEATFEQHPDAAIYRSLPGLGDVLGARVLGEFGDDPERYADTKSRRNYAGTSPITVASGRQRVVKARFIRNQRLIDAIDSWAFSSLTRSPGARAFYDKKRAQHYEHHEALRALGNHLVGILHGCLKHDTLYDETLAWQHQQPDQQPAAA